MVIIKFLRVELNRAINEESIGTKFNYVDKGVMTAFFEVKKTIRIHTFCIGIVEDGIVQCSEFMPISLLGGVMKENQLRSGLLVIILQESFIY